MARAALGFIGLGNMGKPMATRLLDRGNALVAYDIQAGRLERVAALGATTAASPGDVARGCELVFMSLPEPHVVRRVGTELIQHGAAGAVERVWPFLQNVGSQVRHVGPAKRGRGEAIE